MAVMHGSPGIVKHITTFPHPRDAMRSGTDRARCAFPDRGKGIGQAYLCFDLTGGGLRARGAGVRIAARLRPGRAGGMQAACRCAAPVLDDFDTFFGPQIPP